MKKGARSHEEQTRQTLLDLWRGEREFGRSVGCVATTYTFDAAFFEEECLARFIGMETDASEAKKSYLIEREEKLSQNFACVLVDFSQVSVDRSLRWHQLPVTLPRGGIQHSKLSILVWERCIRVLVSSANLTKPGYRANLEYVAVMDFGDEGQLPGQLLKDCVAFVREVSAFAPGHARTSNGPQEALRDFLAMVDARADTIKPTQASEAECFLISLTRGAKQRGVLEQIKERWRGPAPSSAWVLSPFYDQGDDVEHGTKAIADVMTNRGERFLEFLAVGRKLPSGVIQVDAPPELKRSAHPRLKHSFRIIDENTHDGARDVRRRLHAKSLWFERDASTLVMIGSSNFTRAGLGLHQTHNIELNVGYWMSDSSSKFAALCRAAWPHGDELTDIDAAQFAGSGSESEDAEAGNARLPKAFGAALLRVQGKAAVLELEIAAPAPDTFEILTSDREQILTSDSWAAAGKPSVMEVPWRRDRLPSALMVRWTQEADSREAVWVVNVVDASTLPSVSELSDLTLDELIAVLTSARPLHEIVATSEMRRKGVNGSSHVETDPHRRVSTSHHLLKRMRRVSDAFEGMRKRLEEPVYSLESLRWRLHGPVGPMALATKVVSSEGSAAGFMIAELATTLSHVDWNRAGTLSADEVTRELRALTSTLETMARCVAGSDDLTAYVSGVFQEIAQ